jgi:hypothetical protein
MPLDDGKVNIVVRYLTKTRLERMRAQALIQGWQKVKSLDDAVDLLLQVWDKALTQGIVDKLVRPPAHLR